MKFLLDTHIFLWFISGDDRLAPALQATIRDPGNEVYLSAISIWEAVVKYQLGKLPLPSAPDRYLPLQRERHQILSLSLDEASVAHLSKLPAVHRDPFDRMLICQAIEHGLMMMTVDDVFDQYPVAVYRTQITHVQAHGT
jgi:PIN domain nuclease of toxin-antitoxin system